MLIDAIRTVKNGIRFSLAFVKDKVHIVSIRKNVRRNLQQSRHKQDMLSSLFICPINPIAPVFRGGWDFSDFDVDDV